MELDEKRVHPSAAQRSNLPLKILLNVYHAFVDMLSSGTTILSDQMNKQYFQESYARDLDDILLNHFLSINYTKI